MPSSEHSIKVDPAKIGVSYSGAGALFVVELGIAKALIARGVVPSLIAGVSSGALSAVAHALDPASGRGVEVAARALGNIDDGTFGLRWWQVPLHLAFVSRRGAGDNAAIRSIVVRALCEEFGLGPDPPISAVGPPPILVGATDRLSGAPVWFPPEQSLGDALVASSAIPGLFPWVTLQVAGESRLLVDGGIVNNQPLSELVRRGCGTVFAAQVGTAAGPQPPPTNLLDNAIGSVYLAIHAASRLEEGYVRQVLGDRGRILHIRPPLDFPIKGFNFTPALVARVIAESARLTEQWLASHGF